MKTLLRPTVVMLVLAALNYSSLSPWTSQARAECDPPDVSAVPHNPNNFVTGPVLSLISAEPLPKVPEALPPRDSNQPRNFCANPYDALREEPVVEAPDAAVPKTFYGRVNKRTEDWLKSAEGKLTGSQRLEFEMARGNDGSRKFYDALNITLLAEIKSAGLSEILKSPSASGPDALVEIVHAKHTPALSVETQKALIGILTSSKTETIGATLKNYHAKPDLNFLLEMACGDGGDINLYAQPLRSESDTAQLSLCAGYISSLIQLVRNEPDGTGKAKALARHTFAAAHERAKFLLLAPIPVPAKLKDAFAEGERVLNCIDKTPFSAHAPVLASDLWAATAYASQLAATPSFVKLSDDDKLTYLRETLPLNLDDSMPGTQARINAAIAPQLWGLMGCEAKHIPLPTTALPCTPL